jgi:prepilin-type N-terminal cleavage/methylation domain-containing protein
MSFKILALANSYQVMKYLCTMLKKNNHLNSSSKSSPKAFSMIEVAVVLIIVGIFIAGTFAAISLVKKSRILAAQTKTRAAPVGTIPNLVVWLESSLEESFSTVEAENGAQLSAWKDIKSSSTAPTNNGASGASKPIYSNSINSIHAVKFSGDADSYFEIDGSALNNSDYTIIFLEKRQSSAANYFLTDDGTSSADNKKLQLGYSSSGAVIHSQGSGNSYSASVGSYDSSEKPRIFTFIQDSSSGKKTYVNGFLAKEDSDTTKLSGINKLRLGENYNGEIGEFIIFDRALKAEERASIEKYLSEKWTVKRVSPNQDCTNGSVTDAGCVPNCVISIEGSSTTALASGSSSKFVCNQTGYVSGLTTETYTCNGGSISPSLSASQCADDLGCASGYNKHSGACKLKCTITGQVGVTDNIQVDSGSTTASCASGFEGSFQYTCDNGTFEVVNNACAENPLSCTGGEAADKTSFPGYTVHYFLATGTSNLQCTGSGLAEILVVGGGGGGRSESGGGGAGGLVYKTGHSLGAQTYSVTVGAGGSNGASGSNSVFDSITAYGGGGGGPKSNAGLSGGSGGGGGRDGNGAGGTSTKGIADGGTAYGNNGGAGSGAGAWQAAGGGGGAGGAGTVGAGGSSSTEVSGNGGAGRNYSSIFGSTYGDGGWFAGGGGGSNSGSGPNILNGGLGGQGGGGNGYAGSRLGANGMTNTGGGAGGGNTSTTGGSGIVIVKYLGSGNADRCAVSVVGSSTTVVANGFSGAIACNQTGYTGSLSRTCTNGELSPALTANSCISTNGCASGYNSNNNVCELQCSVTAYSNVLSVSSVNSGSSSQACRSGYAGTFTYVCNKGSLTSVSNNCVPKAKCTITGQVGIIDGYQVDSDTSSASCNHEDYNPSGTLTYTCNNGAFSPGANTCALASASTLSCSGGAQSTFSGSTLHAFTSSSSLTCTGSGNAKVLVVGGGGGSGGNEFGGGGAGGVIYRANYPLTAGSYNVTIGNGGNNANGGNSIFGDITAHGGGRGGAKYAAGNAGGSGGGIGRDRNNAAVSGGVATIGITSGGIGYGNAGGTSGGLGSWQGASGGGGAGGAGQNSVGGSQSLEVGGSGGVGINFSATFGTAYGASGWFGGGGGGATFGNGASVLSNGLGGQGGGGVGFISGSRSATSGAANSGGGAGGGSSVTGGSGIVIIRY